MQIIYDHQLDEKALMPLAIKAVETFFIAAKANHAVTPPRHHFNANGKGGLAFTIGAENKHLNIMGFRVYDTFANDANIKKQQLVAIYSSKTGALKALFIGDKLGAIRTAAINGLAIKKLSNPNTKIATIIGAGKQAKNTIHALLAVRQLSTIFVHNRSIDNAKKLASEMQKIYECEFILCDNLQNALSESQIIITATSSHKPVLKTQWLMPSCFLASIGPKQKFRHELPLDIALNTNQIVSDAPNQIFQNYDNYFLDATTPILSLEDIPTSQQISQNNGVNLFLSSGRSGTEIVVGNAILNLLHP